MRDLHKSLEVDTSRARRWGWYITACRLMATVVKPYFSHFYSAPLSSPFSGIAPKLRSSQLLIHWEPSGRPPPLHVIPTGVVLTDVLHVLLAYRTIHLFDFLSTVQSRRLHSTCMLISSSPTSWHMLNLAYFSPHNHFAQPHVCMDQAGNNHFAQPHVCMDQASKSPDPVQVQ